MTEWDLEEEDIGDYYMNISLCLRCKNYVDQDICLEYRGMPERFFGRKNKCKHYDPIWGESP